MGSLDRSNAENPKLSITLTKANDLWWDRIGKNDTPIDKEKMNPVKPMSDMSIEEQAVIKKLQYDQHQKRLGKATSEQTKALDNLRKGWDAEGSPFKGQEFDESMAMLRGFTSLCMMPLECEKSPM